MDIPQVMRARLLNTTRCLWRLSFREASTVKRKQWCLGVLLVYCSLQLQPLKTVEMQQEVIYRFTSMHLHEQAYQALCALSILNCQMFYQNLVYARSRVGETGNLFRVSIALLHVFVIAHCTFLNRTSLAIGLLFLRSAAVMSGGQSSFTRSLASQPSDIDDESLAVIRAVLLTSVCCSN